MKVIMMIHGGVGDFLFQLDLAKRFEQAGVPTIFLVRKNYKFIRAILGSSNVSRAIAWRADGVFYIISVIRSWFVCLVTNDVWVINSFYYKHLRLPTSIFYRVSKILSGKILLSVKKSTDSHYQEIVYKERELIWQRNNRIVSLVTNKQFEEGFPILEFVSRPGYAESDYIHIHPVASSLDKSYSPEKLLETLRLIGDNLKVLITLTPSAEGWYLNEELRNYVRKHNNISLINKFFSPSEIAGYILHSAKFITVNTGLLWLSLNLGKKPVVCDIETEYEWNPEPYGAVRLFNPSPNKLVQAISV